MGTASIHEGVRRMRFSSLLDRQERGEITQEEAAEMLGVHVRTFQRWAARYEDKGEAGLADPDLEASETTIAALLGTLGRDAVLMACARLNTVVSGTGHPDHKPRQERAIGLICNEELRMHGPVGEPARPNGRRDDELASVQRDHCLDTHASA